ncbi:Hypothetical predicted protein [Paramuricea clavata]|uniref:Uncharacterized protein n=1 Tax=Paramuricea clavata TaxID=317549 RepID=A0A6S7G3Z0_PARCT|nr:Hypothetical predicted protein [Paramuricea clavata]
MDRGLYNLAVFLDLKKAFDTVNHDILLAKLELYGIKNTPLMLLKSFLSDRSQKCQVNGELSTLKYLKYGVPQGSILGPLLFLIYINDLPNCLQHSTARMFADDTNITVSGKSIKEAEVAVNVDLNNIREWLLSNRLSLNLVKTEYLLIGSRHNINTLEEQPRVFIGDEPIKGVQVTKTLGVKIGQFLTWDSHIDQISKKISSGISAMKKIKDFTNSDTLKLSNAAFEQPKRVENIQSVGDRNKSSIMESAVSQALKKIEIFVEGFLSSPNSDSYRLVEYLVADEGRLKKQNTIVFQGDPESVESAKSKLISIANKHVNKETTSIAVSEQLFDEVDLYVRGLEPCCEEFLRVDCDGPDRREQDLNVTLVVNEEGQTEYTSSLINGSSTVVKVKLLQK